MTFTRTRARAAGAERELRRRARGDDAARRARDQHPEESKSQHGDASYKRGTCTVTVKTTRFKRGTRSRRSPNAPPSRQSASRRVARDRGRACSHRRPRRSARARLDATRTRRTVRRDDRWIDRWAKRQLRMKTSPRTGEGRVRRELGATWGSRRRRRRAERARGVDEG